MTKPCSDSAFVKRYSSLCEGNGWVIERAASLRPFDNLVCVLIQVISEASEAEQLNLLRSHPELGAVKGKPDSLSIDSRSEQMSAGLHQLALPEVTEIDTLNRLYRSKTGFPFILAVRNMNLQQILQTMHRRLRNTVEEERATALGEVGEIIRLRLEQLER